MYRRASSARRNASSKLSVPARRMISGSACSRAQRTFAFRCAHQATAPPRTTTAITAAAIQARRETAGERTAGAAPDESRAWQEAATSRTSPAVIVRAIRSRTIVRAMISSSSLGTSGRAARIGPGVVVITACITARTLVPSNTRPSRQHLPRDDAERPEVAAPVHILTGRLFRRHVGCRADRAARARQSRHRLGLG